MNKKPKPPLEKVIEKQVKGIYLQFGCSVYKFSQPRPSMQTPGIPDLLVFHEPSKTFFFHEVKVKERSYGQTVHQRLFQHRLELCGGTYILGGVPEALDALRDIAGIGIQKGEK